MNEERLHRLRKLRERTVDHPELHRQVCERIVLIECGDDVPYSIHGGILAADPPDPPADPG